jgi:hypothetical protein
MFSSQEWNYTYYCRIYNLSQNEELKSFDDRNQNCFLNRSSINYIEQDNHSMNFSKSSVEIFAESFKSNQTYQFLVHMMNIENSSLQSIGYLFVEVENLTSPIIIIGCVFLLFCKKISFFL